MSGTRSTVAEGETGVFFDEPAAESLAAAIRAFDSSRFDSQRLRAHAERFSPSQFIARLRAIVEREWEQKQKMAAASGRAT